MIEKAAHIEKHDIEHCIEKAALTQIEKLRLTTAHTEKQKDLAHIENMRFKIALTQLEQHEIEDGTHRKAHRLHSLKIQDRRLHTQKATLAHVEKPRLELALTQIEKHEIEKTAHIDNTK